MASSGLSGYASVVSSPLSKEVSGAAFPLVVQADEAGEAGGDGSLAAAVAWVSAHMEELTAQLRQSGTILFRGFPLKTAEDFDAFVCAFKGWEDLSYEDSLSFAVRKQMSNRICTTNEGRTGGLVFHHEQAQSPRWPSKVFFCCAKAAAEGDGGQTGVCRSDEVLRALEAYDPAFVAACEEKGVKYTIYMSETSDESKGVGRSWKSYFSAGDVGECEARMAELGYTWEWGEGGILKATTPRLEAVVTAPGTDMRCFFNQLPATTNNAIEFSRVGTDGSGLEGESADEPTQEGLDRCLSFGDGSQISLETLLKAKELCEQHSIDIPWQDGDVALIDNITVMHARRIWHGPLGSRQLYASLVA